MQDRKSRSDQWNPAEFIVQHVIEEYEKGVSARQLGFKYNVADVTITSLLKRNNVFIRNRSDAKRTNQIKEDIFDTITEESAYWIGFILADGNIYHPPKRSKQLNIGLAKRDWEHLEKFKKFIGSNKKLYYGKDGVFISFYSNRIVKKLAEYGVVPRKSKIVKVPEQLKDNRHFWRGMVDGDGWVTFTDKGYPTFGLCGTYDVVSGFRDFINSMLRAQRDLKIYHHSQYCCQISYTGSYVRNLLHIIYPFNCLCLERKRIVVCGV